MERGHKMYPGCGYIYNRYSGYGSCMQECGACGGPLPWISDGMPGMDLLAEIHSEQGIMLGNFTRNNTHLIDTSTLFLSQQPLKIMWNYPNQNVVFAVCFTMCLMSLLMGALGWFPKFAARARTTSASLEALLEGPAAQEH